VEGLHQVWSGVEHYQGEGTRSFRVPGGRARLYMGAMEIPIVAFRMKRSPPLEAARLRDFSHLLARFGLELDCVEEEHNYKINRSDTKAYVGRITDEALKLHVGRIVEIGREAFDAIVGFYLPGTGSTAGPDG